MTAGPAEHVGEDRLFIRLILFVQAGFKGNEAVVVLVEGRVDRTGLGDELVQLEGEQRIALTRLLQADIGDTDPFKEILEKRQADILRRTGVAGQIYGNFGQLPGLASDKNPLPHGKGYFVFQPDGHRMDLQRLNIAILIDPGRDG